MSNFFVILVSTFVNIMTALLLVYIVLSWIVPPYNKFRIFVDDLMNRFLDPIRRIMPRTGMLEFSQMIILLVLQFFEREVRKFF